MRRIGHLKFFRDRVGLTQLSLAERTGFSTKTIGRWETGEREPRASDIQKLCEVLGCSEAELLNGPTGTEIVVKIEVRKEECDMSTMTVDMSSNNLIQSVTITPEKCGIGLVFGKDRTLREVCDELLRQEETIEGMRKSGGKALN